MKKALILGGTGFAGRHLAEYLLRSAGRQVVVTGRAGAAGVGGAAFRALDILDAPAVEALLRAEEPDEIYHMAAQASAARSWREPGATVDVNIKGTVNVLEAARVLPTPPGILLIGSGEEYGSVPEEDCPLAEGHALRPGNIYAATKVCQEMIGQLYARAYGLRVVATRSFNHIGPGQGPGFVVADFCRQAARIERGEQENVLRVGNLAARRDFTDVRDVVRAYGLLMERGESGQVYNVGSGRAVSIREVLDRILALCAVPVTVERDEAKFRPLDAPLHMADITALRAATGWEARIPLEQTLRDTLDYWRERI